MLRLGLCCTFRDEPIRFGNTTVTAIRKMKRVDALTKLSELCLRNARALRAALEFCAREKIGSFRINSQILPIKTHVEVGYELAELPDAREIERTFRNCGDYARQQSVRTSFHPDQFVVLNSRKPEVVEASLREIEYQAEVAEWVNADVVNIHGGGAFGDHRAALADFARTVDRLSDRARCRLTVENDDKIFAPRDLLPMCRDLQLPLVYDVHHHRCHGDGLSVEEATAQAMQTWNREPMFHLSSPLEGWQGPHPERHHDFIDIEDFPECWRDLTITIEVEAKAKEAAVKQLQADLQTLPPKRRSSSRRSSSRSRSK